MSTFILIAIVLTVAAVAVVIVPLLKRKEGAAEPAIWAAFGAAGILVFGGGALYLMWSNWTWQGADTSGTPQGMVSNLARKLESNPNDLQGWLMLGRSYSVLEQYELCDPMHERADRLAGGKNVDALELEREFEARLVESSTLAFRVAYSVLRHREDAEDVAQDAFAKAYRNFRQLRDRDRFRAWLVRMTWRVALDHRRSCKRRQAREDAVMAITPQTGNLEADTIAQERKARLWKAIEELPERLRVVTVLAAIEGHGVREVAELLGIAEGTIKSRLFEARQKLQEKLR